MRTKIETDDDIYGLKNEDYKVYKANSKNSTIYQSTAKMKKERDPLLCGMMNKYEVYKSLCEKKELLQYIPASTEISSVKQIMDYTKEFNKIILKPIEFSENRPIFIVEMIDDYFSITEEKINQSQQFIVCCESDFEEFLESNNVILFKYLIQRYIKIMEIGHFSYRIHVSMIREKSNWNCKLICFEIGKTKFVFYKMPFEKNDVALKKTIKNWFPTGCSVEKKMKEINDLCLNICKVLQLTCSNINEYRIDLGIDEERRLWVFDIDAANNTKCIKCLDFGTYYSKIYSSIFYTTSINSF